MSDYLCNIVVCWLFNEEPRINFQLSARPQQHFVNVHVILHRNDNRLLT